MFRARVSGLHDRPHRELGGVVAFTAGHVMVSHHHARHAVVGSSSETTRVSKTKTYVLLFDKNNLCFKSIVFPSR